MYILTGLCDERGGGDEGGSGEDIGGGCVIT